MMLDFPNNPVLDETFLNRWIWNGRAWAPLGGSDEPKQGQVRYHNDQLQYFDGSAWQNIP